MALLSITELADHIASGRGVRAVQPSTAATMVVKPASAVAKFVPVSMPQASASPTTPVAIQIDLRRSATPVQLEFDTYDT